MHIFTDFENILNLFLILPPYSLDFSHRKSDDRLCPAAEFSSLPVHALRNNESKYSLLYLLILSKQKLNNAAIVVVIDGHSFRELLLNMSFDKMNYLIIIRKYLLHVIILELNLDTTIFVLSNNRFTLSLLTNDLLVAGE